MIRAIGTVERALALHGAPVYAYHEIVHNGHVVDDLRSRGAVFVQVIEATCPLVAKVHLQARRYVQLGHTLIVIGHAGHEEVEGTIGAVDGPVHLVTTAEDAERLVLPSDARPAYVTQTTLSLDDTRLTILALQRRFPGLHLRSGQHRPRRLPAELH